MDNPKRCKWFSTFLISLDFLSFICSTPLTVNSDEVLVHSENLDFIVPPYINNKLIEYSLKISNLTFSGFKETGTKLSPNQLDKFEQVYHINGNLTVTANHPEFKDLNIFRNVETVYTLIITNTSLFYLNLLRLENVKYGVVIEHNKNLCVNQSKEFWQNIMSNPKGVLRIGGNKPEYQCDTSCDQECVQELGCWGLRPDQCRKCRNCIMVHNRTCVRSCDKKISILYDKDCWLCDEECDGGCSYPGPSGCNNCKHVRRGDDCVSKCSHGEYIRDRVCTECHRNCLMYGCTGPLGYEGDGGCNPCEKAVFKEYLKNDYYNNPRLVKVRYCLKLNDTCPEKYYEDKVPHDALGHFTNFKLKLVCFACHYLCLKCTGYGFNRNVCQECISKYKDCICPLGTYSVQELGRNDCYPCHTGCKECRDGDTCVDCHDNYHRVYTELVPRSQAPFYCAETCPNDQPFFLFSNLYHNYCFSMNYISLEGNAPRNELKYIYFALPIAVCLLLLVVYICTFNAVNWYKIPCRNKQFLEESEEYVLTTNLAPGRAELQWIEDFTLRKMETIKKDGFSTIYKGVFYLGNSGTQVLVAIKRFSQYNNSVLTNKVLKEANFVGRLNHPHVLRLLAIGVTSKLTLVTQFLPLGDMLQYLRSTNSGIKPETQISWGKQIATAMDYLEKQGYVHRNLAAKKVLIFTMNQVKVTCFGKERFTNAEQSSFVSNVESLPFQWLALETLKQGIYTHKSDVWSFGIVLWEILTYGQEPFGETSLPVFLLSLEGGQRLQQPDSSSAYTYSVLATCWVEEASARPSFQELVGTLSRMARDPTHFIFVSRKEDNLTAPELPPREYNSEIDKEEEDLEISPSNHSYVNTTKKAPDSLDLDQPARSWITSQPLHTYMNSDHIASNPWYAEMELTSESCDEYLLEKIC